MRKTYFAIMMLLVCLMVMGSVMAISGRIGNARMFLEAKVTEGKTTTIERTILVRNVNNESINIVMEAEGNLKDFITIPENEFTLEAEKDKKARFIITVEQPGKYDGKINVYFTPITGGGPGVALSSTIFLTVTGKGEKIEFPETIEDDEPEEDIEEEEEDEEETDEEITGGVSVSLENQPETKEENSEIGLGLIIFIVLLIGVVVLGVVIIIRREK